MRQLRRRAAARDQRTLLLLTAAQGDGAQKVWRQLERERKNMAAASAPEETEEEADRETPLCQADFERMMIEE